MIRNILWKVDGTLFDTYPAITYAMSKSLNEMGLSIALNEIDGLVRQSIDYCIENLCQRFKLDPELLRFRFAESYRTIDPANQPPFPGVREVCDAIHARGGLNVIVTHRIIQSTQRLLTAHAFSALINDIFSAEHGYPRKPAPSKLLAVLEKHNLATLDDFGEKSPRQNSRTDKNAVRKAGIDPRKPRTHDLGKDHGVN